MMRANIQRCSLWPLLRLFTVTQMRWDDFTIMLSLYLKAWVIFYSVFVCSTIPVRCAFTFLSLALLHLPCRYYTNYSSTKFILKKTNWLHVSIPVNNWLKFAWAAHDFWTGHRLTLPWPGLAHSDMAASSFNLPSSDIRIVCWALNLPKGWAGVDRRGSAVYFTLASGPESGRLRICDATNQFARIQYRIEFNDSLALTLGVLWNLFISLRQPRFDLSAQRSTTRNNFQTCCHFADAGSHDGSLLGLVLPVCLYKNNHPILSCLPFLKKINYSCFWYVYLFI